MSNMMAIGENTENVFDVVDAFINTKESTEERHLRRVNKIMNIERR